MIYCYGITALSQLVRIKNKYPAADGYAEILGSRDSIGGEAAGTALCLAKFGHDCQLDGLKVGAKGDGKRVLDELKRRKIQVSRIASGQKRIGAAETVYADNQTRTVFGNYVEAVYNRRHRNAPSAALIRKAAYVVVDPFFGQDSQRAAALARKAKVPYCLIDVPPGDPSLPDASATVISNQWLKERFPQRSSADLWGAYHAKAKGLVVLTDGQRPLVFGRQSQPTHRMKPFEVQAVDTTGAGDSFRAGIIHGQLAGWDDRRTVRFAAALAALVCQSWPACMNSPSLKRVQALVGS